MFKPDVRIAIAYSSPNTHLIAYDVKQRLDALAKKGYPVSASFIDEKFTKAKGPTSLNNNELRADIINKMITYFTNCDYGIFLFDRMDIPCPNNEEKVISYNIMFEYGLAKSVYKERNRRLPLMIFQKNSVIINNRFNGNSDYEIDDRVFEIDDKKTIEEAANYIIKTIHDNIVARERIFGLPQRLNKLEYRVDNLGNLEKIEKTDDNKNKIKIRNTDQNEYLYHIKDTYRLNIMSPFDNNGNTYWANLSVLSNLDYHNVNEDKLPRTLEKFIIEYESFYNDTQSGQEEVNIYKIQRQLMYMVDRIVLLMYLNKSIKQNSNIKLYIPSRNTNIDVMPDYWKNKIDQLIRNINGLPQNDPNREYIVKVGNLLQAILDYHDDYSKKTEAEKEKIRNAIYTIYRSGSNSNPMVYALAADYYGLCCHKDANTKLMATLGLDRLYITELEDYQNFKEKLKLFCKRNRVNELVSVKEIFENAIEAFRNTIETEENLQNSNNENWYIWRSYAEYNKARCEFMLYYIGKNTQNQFLQDTYLSWEENIIKSCEQRKNDFNHAKRDNLPRDITHNLESEYYHAVYEWKLYQAIMTYIDKDYRPIENNDVNLSDFENWTKESLLLGDTISVLEKGYKYDKLKKQVDCIEKNRNIKKNLKEALETKKKEYERIKKNTKWYDRKTIRNNIDEIKETISELDKYQNELIHSNDIISIIEKVSSVHSKACKFEKTIENNKSLKEKVKTFSDTTKKIAELLKIILTIGEVVSKF